MARGCFGSPSFFVGDEMFFGKEQLRVQLAKLAQTPAELQATITDLEGWARKIRQVLDRDEDGGGDHEADT